MQVLLLLQSDPATRLMQSADGEDLDDADTGGLLALQEVVEAEQVVCVQHKPSLGCT